MIGSVSNNCSLQGKSSVTIRKEYSVESVANQIFRQLPAVSTTHQLAQWRNKIALLDPAMLYRILLALSHKIVSLEDPERWIELLSECFPLEKLEEIARTRYPQHISAIETAKELRAEARHFLEIAETRFSVSWRNRAETFLDQCITVLEAFLNAFGLADFFRASESSLDGEIKSGRVMQLLMVFSTISTLLLPVLGATLATAIVGGTLLGTTTLSLLFPYIRPAPSHLPKATNWTKQYRQGELIAPTGRKETLDAIAALISSSARVKTHPMLIGKSGIGKTETAKAFVQAIERGDYPELKGKQVFYFNMADLVQGAEVLTGENKILANIDRAMGSHRDDMILIFDEIQLACQKETATIGEQLKTMLDPGNGRFPHVIGITTEEEYYRDIYLNNSAFARRFRRINIENPTPAETLEILTNTAVQLAPQVLIAEGAMEMLVAKTKAAFPTAPEPITPLKILTKCLQKAADSQKSSLAKQTEDLRIQIRSIHAQGSATQGESLLPYRHREELVKLQKELEQLCLCQEKQESELSHFFRHRDELLASKKETFRTALSVLKEEEKKLAAFLLRTHFFAPAQIESLLHEAKRLGIRTILDASLIDAVIEEELGNDRKVQEAVERGRAQIQARTAGANS